MLFQHINYLLTLGMQNTHHCDEYVSVDRYDARRYNTCNVTLIVT